MSSSAVVQRMTLINHLHASLCGPPAWTAAQNKEIESQWNRGRGAEPTRRERSAPAPPVNTNRAEAATRQGVWLKGMRDTERRLVQV